MVLNLGIAVIKMSLSGQEMYIFDKIAIVIMNQGFNSRDYGTS